MFLNHIKKTFIVSIFEFCFYLFLYSSPIHSDKLPLLCSLITSLFYYARLKIKLVLNDTATAKINVEIKVK